MKERELNFKFLNICAMSLNLMIKSTWEYCLAIVSLMHSKVVLAMIPIAYLIELTPGGEELTMATLVFCYLADSVLGLLLALQTKTFDWKRLPRMIYKIVVFYFTLRISQMVGDLLIIYNVEVVGKHLFPFFLLVITIIEAVSAIGNADKLYPNKATQALIGVLNRISENALEKLNERDLKKNENL